jgi:hypothetical protein
MPTWLQQLLLAVSSLILFQFILFARWLWRRMMDDAINRKFIRDMAINHLPHIYHGMKRIAETNGVELDEPPPVQWVDLSNGHGKSWREMT